MKCTVLTIGQRLPDWAQEACEDYLKRFPPDWKVEVKALKAEPREGRPVAAIMQVTGVWNDYVLGLVFAGAEQQPMTVQLNNIVNSVQGVKEYNVHFAGAILAALPTLIVYIVSGRYFVRGLMSGAVKG